jgi:hypothetical protein
MIVERKQYGCIQILLVQIGLALYLIVLFLGTCPTGEVKPQVLRVQKVAEAGRQVTISALLPQFTQLRLSTPVAGDSVITSTQEQEILNLVAPVIYAQAIASSITQIPADHLNQSSVVQGQTIATPSLHSLYTIGSKPRAPTTT